MTEDAHGMVFRWKVPRAYRRVCNDCGTTITTLGNNIPPRLRVTRADTSGHQTTVYVEPVCPACWREYQRND